MFDSAQDWLNRLPAWDGIDRITGFMHTHLGAHAETPDQRAYHSAVGCYFWSAMAGRILNPGSQTDMVVILVSPQGTGKSSAVREIAPHPSYYTEICLSDSDADRARLTRGKSLVELSELRGLHTKDLESIKAIVTRREDSWTPKYMEMSTTYRRRYLMVGTTNDDHFLADPTGARRWLPIHVGKQDIPAIKRDHAQLWAQARDLYMVFGILWKDAQTLAVLEHDQFTIHDAWGYPVDNYLKNTLKQGICEYVQIAQILEVGLEMRKGQFKRSDEMRIAAILRKCGFSSRRVREGNTVSRGWYPPDSWFVATCDNLL
jgi:predicted P-loop ATPase